MEIDERIGLGAQAQRPDLADLVYASWLLELAHSGSGKDPASE